MGAIERMLGVLGYAPRSRLASTVQAAVETAVAEDRKSRRTGSRAFEAARISRLNAGWTTENLSLNHNLYRDLRILRARSRQMARDNDYVKQFLRMVKSNVIGHSGVALQVQARKPDGTLDKLDSDALERAFAEWSRPGNCDVTGRLSMADLERLAIEMVARDGETLIQELYGRGPYGYQLRMIDAALLDENYNRDVNEDVKIRMGVELNALRRPTAYYLFAPEASDPITGTYTGAKHVRIPADQIIHAFLVEDVEQVRGVPWMHTILSRTNQLHGFEEAAVVAARMGASKMGWYKSPDGGLDPLASGTEATGEEGGGGALQGELIDEAEPGHFSVLPQGYDFVGFNPDYPHQHYGAFVKSCLRGISAGLGVSYNGLANDLEGVNYSSIRAGLQEEREVWKALQDWFIGIVLLRVYPNWLRAYLASKKATLPAGKYDKFNAAVFQGRRWQWVDPKNDVDSRIAEIENGLTSRGRVIRERGEDPEEIWTELEAENDRLAKIITPKTPAAAGVAVSGGQNDNGNG